MWNLRWDIKRFARENYRLLSIFYKETDVNLILMEKWWVRYNIEDKQNNFFEWLANGKICSENFGNIAKYLEGGNLTYRDGIHIWLEFGQIWPSSLASIPL